MSLVGIALLSLRSNQWIRLRRDAEAGFTVCDCCAFENFTRFAYCTLCGEKLPANPEADAGDGDAAAGGLAFRLSAATRTRQQLRARYSDGCYRRWCG